jgi:hypothetical protein
LITWMWYLFFRGRTQTPAVPFNHFPGCVSLKPGGSSANSRSPASKMSSLDSTRRRSRRTQHAVGVQFFAEFSVRRCGWLRVKCGRHHGRYLRLRSVYIQCILQLSKNQPTYQSKKNVYIFMEWCGVVWCGQYTHI